MLRPPRRSPLFPYTTLFRSVDLDRPRDRDAVPDVVGACERVQVTGTDNVGKDRKSTRLNSSHEWISYAVFCLKKKKTEDRDREQIPQRRQAVDENRVERQQR